MWHHCCRRRLPVLGLTMLVLLLVLHASGVALLHALAASNSSDVAMTIYPYPNVDLGERGYDILFGNPESSAGPDPGWRDSVFDLRARNPDGSPRMSADGRFYVPYGASLFTEISCSSTATTETLLSTEEYQRSLQISASLEVSYRSLFSSASFSASADYKTVSSSLKSLNTVFTKATAKCQLYRLEHWQDFPAPISTQFREFVATIVTAIHTSGVASAAVASLIQDFVRQFGTHVPTIIYFGSRFGQLSEFATSNLNTKSSTELSVKVSASFSTLFSKASASYSRDSASDDASELAMSSTRQIMFTVGSLPPASGDMNEWMSTSASDPYPIRSTGLVPLSVLLQVDRFPELNSGELQLFRSALEAFYATYCAAVGGACDAAAPSVPRCFGGFYQLDMRLSPASTDTSGIPSWGTTMAINNPFTQRTSCPIGYKSVALSPSNGWSTLQVADTQDQTAWMGTRMCVRQSDECNGALPYFSYKVSTFDSMSFDATTCLPNSVNPALGCRCAATADMMPVMRLPMRDGGYRVYFLCIDRSWQQPLGGALITSTLAQRNVLEYANFGEHVRGSTHCPPRYVPNLIGSHTFTIADSRCSSSQMGLNTINTYLCINALSPIFEGAELSDVDAIPESRATGATCVTTPLPSQQSALPGQPLTSPSDPNLMAAPLTDYQVVFRRNTECIVGTSVGTCNYNYDMLTIVTTVGTTNLPLGLFYMRYSNLQYVILPNSAGYSDWPTPIQAWWRRRVDRSQPGFEIVTGTPGADDFVSLGGPLLTFVPNPPLPARFALRNVATRKCVTTSFTFSDPNWAPLLAADCNLGQEQLFTRPEPEHILNSLTRWSLDLKTTDVGLWFQWVSVDQHKNFLAYLPETNTYELNTRFDNLARALCINSAGTSFELAMPVRNGSAAAQLCQFEVIDVPNIRYAFPSSFTIQIGGSIVSVGRRARVALPPSTANCSSLCPPTFIDRVFTDTTSLPYNLQAEAVASRTFTAVEVRPGYYQFRLVANLDSALRSNGAQVEYSRVSIPTNEMELLWTIDNLTGSSTSTFVIKSAVDPSLCWKIGSDGVSNSGTSSTMFKFIVLAPCDGSNSIFQITFTSASV